MTKKIDLVLIEASKKIELSKETVDYMKEELEIFLNSAKKRIAKLNIDVEIFVGGSFAKNTIMKKGSYDIDVFLRFDRKYPGKDFTKLTKKILKKIKKVYMVHGSREYFQIRINPWFKIEIIPVRKIKKSDEAENITDLSFAHVNYINKKVKSEKILRDIKLGKAFCQANGSYGAESYIHGFSGYSIELLVYHYKSFEKTLRELIKKRKNKLTIDTEKQYKSSKEIMFEINGSKLLAPVVLVDPTLKERNVLAALSDETFEKFKESARKFLKKPSINFFFEQKIDLDELKRKANKDGKDFVLIYTKTKKQEGDIAGTKLLKFHKHLLYELKKYFDVEDDGFKYRSGKIGKGYLILNKKKFVIYSGPLKSDKKNVEKFKKEHIKTYIKENRLFANKPIEFTVKQFFRNWCKKNKLKMKQMSISRIKII